SELLRDGLVGQLAPKQTEFISHVFDSGQHLLSLINDILDLSKVEAGKMTLDLEEIQLNDLLQTCMGIVRDQAARRGITLTFAPAIPDIPADRLIAGTAARRYRSRPGFVEPSGRVARWYGRRGQRIGTRHTIRCLATIPYEPY